MTSIGELEAAAAHSDASIALAKKESEEHLQGMTEVFQAMRKRPFIVRAYAVDDTIAPTGDNVKTIHFIRHGQGFHNLVADLFSSSGRTWVQHTKSPDNPYAMPEILDAPLTEKGRQQALILQPRVRTFDIQPELIVLSPNCRAIQTGTIVFEHLIGKIPFLAHEMAREENGVHYCDKRRSKSRQEKEFPMIDFSLLETDDDVIFREDRRETKMEVGERIYKFMEWLARRSEKTVAVSSHSSWLLTVFNGVCECDDELKGWFQTGEMRSVKLQFIRDG
jgi:broad specificity phosphatase PhoE